MKKNKKVKNATPTHYDGIDFKSTLEKNVYKALVELGIRPLYEAYTITLSDKVRPTVPFYVRHKKGFELDLKPLDDITYTPDFTFWRNGIFPHSRCSGMSHYLHRTDRRYDPDPVR